VEITNPPHPVDEILPFGKLFTYGLQHVLAMYAGAVAVPLIVAHGLGLTKDQLIYLINADLFTCGIATLIQTVGIGKLGIRIPIIQGVTFAAVTPMILIGQKQGITAIYGSIIAAGIVTFLISPYFSRLLRFFAPVVTGTIITIIGVALIPVAVRWAGGGDPSAGDFASGSHILLALITLSLVVLFYRCFTGFLSNIAVLLGLVAGTIAAIPFGLVSFSQLSTAGWLGVTTPFAFGLPTFNSAAIAAMVLVMLVTMSLVIGGWTSVPPFLRKSGIARLRVMQSCSGV
jgi:uracil-xanthine permease